MDMFFFALAAFLAGLVDAVAGGGGLIQVPALFTALPGEGPAVLFGTNKAASVCGTANAAWRYAQRVDLPWRTIVLPMAVSAFGFSFVGAATVAWMPKELIRPLVLVLLVLVALYTVAKPDFGAIGRRRLRSGLVGPVALLIGAVLGFYDGFFGPGAGSFMIFALVGLFGFDFLRASAAAKIVNLATNAAALSYFIPTGSLLWPIAGVMAFFNILGAWLGTRLAIRHGSGFVRWVFLVVTSALIGKFGYDTLCA